MGRNRNVLLIALFTLWPSVASAQLEYLWDWGERFLGPGPWNGHSLIVRLPCGKQMTSEGVAPNKVRFERDREDRMCWQDDSDARIKTYLEMRAGFAYTGGLFYNHEPQRFGDRPLETGNVWQVKLEPFAMSRLSPVIDVGGGMGLIVFGGDGVDAFVRYVATPISLVITPGAAIHPDREKWRLIKFRYELNYMPQGLQASDFNSTSGYKMDTEWTGSTGVVIDFAVLK